MLPAINAMELFLMKFLLVFTFFAIIFYWKERIKLGYKVAKKVF